MPRSLDETIVVDGPPEWFDEAANEANAALYNSMNPSPIAMTAKPFAWRDERDIPRREWLYGTHLIRKFLSVDVAAGGVGKSSVKIVEALALATGRNLLGKEPHEGPVPVWLYNLEDPEDEIERRIHAACKHFRIAPDDIGNRLYVNSGRDQPLVIAEETPNGARILRPTTDAIIEEIMARNIAMLSVDPFVSSHTVSENDNAAIDMVAKEWGRIADVCRCSINLVHHVRKANGTEANADSARGASSLIGAARSVIVYNAMTSEEAKEAGINANQRGFYFRTQNDKANLCPKEGADWHRMNNVDLDNGDSVGVACPWNWPDLFAGINTAKVMEVQRAIGTEIYALHAASDQWVGNIIATVLALDPEDDAKKLGKIIREWIKTGVLTETEMTSANRKRIKGVTVGDWIAE